MTRAPDRRSAKKSVLPLWIALRFSKNKQFETTGLTVHSEHPRPITFIDHEAQFLTGKLFLAQLYRFEDQKLCTLDTELSKGSLEDFPILGTALSAIYQVATCYGSCRGGDHILEALAGRSFDLAASAISLVRLGYYDQALSLIRSLGEIANLLIFFCDDPTRYPAWVLSSEKDRKNKFGPKQIRDAIGDKELVPMDETWYKELCGLVTHVTPTTVPNMHNSESNKHVGGKPQPEGFKDCISQLSEILAILALSITKMVGRDELFDTMTQEIEQG